MMKSASTILSLLLMATTTAGCSAGEKGNSTAHDEAGNAQEVAPAAVRTEPARPSEPDREDGNSVSGNATASAEPPSGPALETYEGKEPFEKMDGVAFLDHTVVRAEVEKVVTDPAIRKWVLNAGTSPWSPMFIKAGQLVATGCQEHACEKRSWAVVIDVKTHIARVCFEQDERTRWYSATGVHPQDGDCPSDEDGFDA